MRSFLIALFAALLAASPAMAKGPACAHPWDGGKKGVEAGLTMHEVLGKKRASLVFNYNALDPVSTWAPDHVYLFTPPTLPWTVIVFVKKKCIIFADKIPAQFMDKLFEEPGTPS
jgi:hypothetical protein